jgi:hypothetical protein
MNYPDHRIAVAFRKLGRKEGRRDRPIFALETPLCMKEQKSINRSLAK